MLLLACPAAYAQIGWIAPEGKIYNYRTLMWADFLGKPDPKNEHVISFIRPAPYYTADNGEHLPNGRVNFDFKVKCAFQSESWSKNKEEFTLIYQQNNYDIALLYSNMLRMQLTGRDYSANNYDKEIDDIHDGLSKKREKVYEDYERETDFGNKRENQPLWDLRIRKCMENLSDEYFASPEAVLQGGKGLGMGQMVKRGTDEPIRQFATRCRPLYAWYTDEMGARSMETTEWTAEPAVLAFYMQNYTVGTGDIDFKDNKRILAYAFMPVGKGSYKRVFVDSFSNDGNPVKVEAAFFANADSDATKELIIITTSTVKNRQVSGTFYATTVYDLTSSRVFPARLRRLEGIGEQLSGGLDGSRDGKPATAKMKNEKDVREALKKLGFG
ncbi:hypothetical protein GCM10023093_20800 [Nemorincola caseinilytica]|uniref:Uncharacterized protein n=2 Tax=Nemorincola caseinilytica TaxID=2054315 RepID=A0ABP8NFM8_9BACT